MAWTTPVDQTTGTLITASIYNSHIIDNLKYLHGDAGEITLNNSVNNGATGSAGGPAGTKLSNLGTLFTSSSASTSTAIAASVVGDTTDYRFRVLSTGEMRWASGTALYDVALARTATSLLQVTGGVFGYGAGTGGAVTQATSKSTAVTLNTSCGTITMNAAALAAGASVSFNLSNSNISLTDTVIVCPAGATFTSYRVEVANIVANSCLIRVTNVSGGSLSEALKINFAIITSRTA